MVATSNELAVVLVSAQKTAHLRREGAQPTIFGLPDQRLTIHHDSGTGAMPYVMSVAHCWQFAR